MNSFEVDQPLDLRLKALNLSRGFSHEPPRASPPLPPPPYSPQQYGTPLQTQNLLVVNNMVLGARGALSPGSSCNNKLVLTATITPDYYQTLPTLRLHPSTLEHHQQQQQQQLQQQHQQQQQQLRKLQKLQQLQQLEQHQTHQQLQYSSTVHVHHQHNQQHPLDRHNSDKCTSPPSQTMLGGLPLSSPGNICNPAPVISNQNRSLNSPLASPISSFKPSSSPSAHEQPPASHQRNSQTNSSPSTPTSSASPMIRQHSLISRYNCKPCGIVFSQPETLRAHQEGYCTKTNRNQLRSQSASFAIRHPADC